MAGLSVDSVQRCPPEAWPSPSKAQPGGASNPHTTATQQRLTITAIKKKTERVDGCRRPRKLQGLKYHVSVVSNNVLRHGHGGRAREGRRARRWCFFFEGQSLFLPDCLYLGAVGALREKHTGKRF